ncbi:non-ribosomal peptide synthetase [Chitinophaga nivalis]|uniref:Amino acid adenylation domain-containing protein n=1 Tax=Chitinophaga nivalis TaxID=2991709 RepID=A0ABT3IJ26_9BACT|nr:amino acid adenylation domain-containing protein [Chitinophaga nivalis]MCW3466341.1 amino acid adenylation domain-containing protein [Chitinophaga nivalis]MCW3483968.1 amino acid adenylation domain-containing protein [Chitinophaga nivalis]
MRELLNKIKENHILLEIIDGKLRMFADQSDIDPALLAEIREHKTALFDFLSGSAAGMDPDKIDIPVAPEADSYPLSASQRMLWILGQYEDSNVAYNMPGVYVFEGALDQAAFAGSFDALIARHESLRTVFGVDEEGEIRQYIRSAAASGFRMETRDLRSAADPEAAAIALVQADCQAAFNLATGPLIRAGLYQVAAQKWVFVYVLHHIITDEWSMGILIRELLQLYNARLEGSDAALRPLPIQYKDFAVWQQGQTATLQADKAYWLSQFAGTIPVLQLNGDFPRPAVKTYNGGFISKPMPPKVAKGVRNMCREEGATLFMGLLALVNLLLYRYSGQEDIVIGSPIAGREHADLDDQIGFYLNTLALRARFKGTDTYRELLRTVKQGTLQGYAHQGYPFDDLINALNLQRDISRSPLFDVMLIFRHVELDSREAQQLGDLKVSAYEAGEGQHSKFDLSFDFVEAGGDIQVGVRYNSDIYTKNTALQMADHLIQLLEAIIAAPGTAIQELPYLSAAEKQQLLVKFRADQASDFTNEETFVSKFATQAAYAPERLALVFKEQRITYGALENQSNQLMNHLKKHYLIKTGSLIGIMLDRSADMIVAILAVLKLGNAYVPIDPEYPDERIDFLLKDTGITLLLTQTSFTPRLKQYKGAVYLQDKKEHAEAATTPARTPAARLDDLAYVIYTSGSTGQPKGVMISHRALLDYIYGVLSNTNIEDCETCGLISTIAADLGNTVLYPALMTGITLHIFTAAAVIESEQLLRANLDGIKIVPSHWKALQTNGQLFAPAKCLIFGGEQLTPDILTTLREQGSTCNVYNHYGPSEATIGKLITAIDVQQPPVPIPLGAPFCHGAVYVLDALRQLCPVGVTGEIYISGNGVANGYWNNPELTATRFVEDPFRPGEKMYRTGDLGYWLPEGKIVFAGRIDDQVKIRGYRIEPGEVTAALRRHPEIEEAVVVPKKDAQGNPELVAYLVMKTALTISATRSFLAQTLPGYMIPAHYVPLPALPLTENGKVDRNRLPLPAGLGMKTATPYVAPRNETEEKLVALWQELLGQEKIGVDDNFFELSGHSLKAIRLTSQIKKVFDVNISLQVLFNYPTVAGIAGEIEKIYWANNELFDTENTENFSI